MTRSSFIATIQQFLLTKPISIIKAAVALRKRIQSSLGAEITLTKRIPAQGGLGGASSNAAVTLFALNASLARRLKGRPIMAGLARELRR